MSVWHRDRAGASVSARLQAPALADPLQWLGPMLLFRSLVLGLLGACCLLLATRPGARVVERIIYRPGPPVATIIDVSAGVPAVQLGSLVHLGPGEHVIAVDDHAVADDLDAGAVLAQLDPRPAFVDLQVTGGRGGQRRVVLLLH